MCSRRRPVKCAALTTSTTLPMRPTTMSVTEPPMNACICAFQPRRHCLFDAVMCRNACLRVRRRHVRVGLQLLAVRTARNWLLCGAGGLRARLHEPRPYPCNGCRPHRPSAYDFGCVSTHPPSHLGRPASARSRSSCPPCAPSRERSRVRARPVLPGRHRRKRHRDHHGRRNQRGYLRSEGAHQ